MAIGITYKSSIYTTNAGGQTGSPTWTPAANSLLIAFVVQSYASSPVDPTAVAGHGVSYSKLTLGTSTLSTTHQLSIWVGKAGASPTNAAPATTVSGTTTGSAIIEFEVTGCDVSGTALQAIVASSATNTGASGTSATVTLAGATNRSNRAMTFVVQLNNAAPTAAGAWTLTAGAAGNYNTPATGAAALFETGAFDTAGAATVASGASWRMVGIEIKGVPTTHTNTGALAASAATVTGTAQDRFTTSGALHDGSAVVAGTSVHGVKHATSGALAAGAAVVRGADRQVVTMLAGPALTGTGVQNFGVGGITLVRITLLTSATATRTPAPKTGTGALAAGSAAVTGTATHRTLHATSGALVAAPATITGSTLHPHLSSGDLAADEATVTGSTVTGPTVLPHTSSGDLAAGSATVTGTSVTVPLSVAPPAVTIDTSQGGGGGRRPSWAKGGSDADATAAWAAILELLVAVAMTEELDG